MAMTIERRQKLPYETFMKEYLEPRRPVILTDAADHWPALGWTPDYFRRHFADVKVTARAESDGRRSRIGRREYRMPEYVDAVNASTPDKPGPYMTGFAVRQVPRMLRELSPPYHYMRDNWLDSRLLPAYTIDLLFGPAGGRIPYLHRDGYHHHSFTTMMYGRKLFIFYPPDQIDYMYPKEGVLRAKSSVDDPERPDLKKYPLFAKATPSRCELVAGETLLIPAGWWHFTRVVSTAINTRHCYVDDSNIDDMIAELRYQIGLTSHWSPVGTAPVDSPIYPKGAFLAGLLAVRALRRRGRQRHDAAVRASR